MKGYPTFDGLGKRLYWSYANLCMFFFALREEKKAYDTQCFMVRARMYKGFHTGTMTIHSMFIDQKMKLQMGNQCAYCGDDDAATKYSIDHILPQIKGGLDVGDNLIMVCSSCNSSKRHTDLLEWYDRKDWYVDPWILRNYLKLVIEYCEKNDLMNKHRDEIDFKKLPFNPDYLPLELPTPLELGLI